MHEMSRKKDESIFIGEGIEIIVLGIDGEEVRLGIKAQEPLQIHKGEDYEVFQQIQQFNRESVYSANLEKAQMLFNFRD